MSLRETMSSLFARLIDIFKGLVPLRKKERSEALEGKPEGDDDSVLAASPDEPRPPLDAPSVFGRFGRGEKEAPSAKGDVAKGGAAKQKRLLVVSFAFLMLGAAFLAFYARGLGISGDSGGARPRMGSLSFYEEFFYCPLGFPLGGAKAQAELRLLGALQPSPLGEQPFNVRSGDLVHLRGEGFEAFFIDRGDTVEPRHLRVTSGRIGVKWGIRVGEQMDVARFLLGEPAATSADIAVYRDVWGSEVLMQMRSDRIASIEWRFPLGLRVE